MEEDMWEIGNTLYLSGIAALLVPLIIHLYNRRKNKVKLMGDLSWLNEIKPSQSNFRHIYQWPLMILRMLIITIALLLLIDLHRTESSKVSASNIILVHPEATDSTSYRQLAREWEDDSVAVHWLQPKLPDIEEPANSEYNYNLWSLVAEADFRFHPEHIHVVAPNRTDIFEGNIPPLHASVSWQFLENNKDTFHLVDVNKLRDVYEFHWYKSNSQQSNFVKQRMREDEIIKSATLSLGQDRESISVKNSSTIFQVPVRGTDTLLISVKVHQDYQKEWVLMQNVIQAFSEVHNLPVSFIEDSNQADWIFLFNEDRLEDQEFEKTKLMFIYNPVDSEQWLELHYLGVVLIRRKLSTGNILEGGLFEELRPYFLQQKFKNAELPATDYRRFDMTDIPSHSSKYEVKEATTKQIDSKVRLWLSGVLLFLILIERGWPKKNN